MNVEYLYRQGTSDLFKVDNRYLVYLHTWANCQHIVVDTKEHKDITQTQKGQEMIIAAIDFYCNDIIL